MQAIADESLAPALCGSLNRRRIFSMKQGASLMFSLMIESVSFLTEIYVMTNVVVHELFAVDIGAFRFLGKIDGVHYFILELTLCEFISQVCWFRAFHNHFRFGQRDLENELFRQIEFMKLKAKHFRKKAHGFQKRRLFKCFNNSKKQGKKEKKNDHQKDKKKRR